MRNKGHHPSFRALQKIDRLLDSIDTLPDWRRQMQLKRVAAESSRVSSDAGAVASMALNAPDPRPYLEAAADWIIASSAA